MSVTCVTGAVVLYVQASSFDEFDATLTTTLFPLSIVLGLSVTAAIVKTTSLLTWLSACCTCRQQRSTASLANATPTALLSAAQSLDVRRREWVDRLVSAALTVVFLVYPGTSSQIMRAFRCQVNCRALK